MELVLKYLESHRESILMDLELIKNDTKTRYAIEKRKQLEPMLEQVTRAVEILSSVPQANELLPHVSLSVCKHQRQASVAGIITCLDCGKCIADY